MYLTATNNIATDDFNHLIQLKKEDVKTLALVKRCPNSYPEPKVNDFSNMKDFLFFYGHKQLLDEIDESCLSNWYPAKFKEGQTSFFNTEQFMMYHKAILFNDTNAANQILANPDPRTCKAIGRTVKNFDNDFWIKHRFSIVTHGNFLKFSQNPELRKFLLNTKSKVLVEASPYDCIWGIGLSKKDPLVYHPECWRGTNLLGFALMNVREIFKNSLV